MDAQVRKPVVVSRSNIPSSTGEKKDTRMSLAKPPQAAKFSIKTTNGSKAPRIESSNQSQPRHQSVGITPTSNVAEEIEKLKRQIEDLENSNKQKKETLNNLLEKGQNMEISKNSYNSEHESLLKEFKALESKTNDLNNQKQRRMTELTALQQKEKQLKQDWDKLGKHM